MFRRPSATVTDLLGLAVRFLLGTSASPSGVNECAVTASPKHSSSVPATRYLTRLLISRSSAITPISSMVAYLWTRPTLAKRLGCSWP
jgi:hypothetical protein